MNARPIALAQKQATRLTKAELAEIMTPLRGCVTKLREGVATEDQHTVVRTHVMLALAIEHSRIVRGLREHLEAGQAALAAVHARAMVTGVWQPVPLCFDELDAIAEAVDLHEFQLQQLSAGELHRITRKLMNQLRSSGGLVEHRQAAELGLKAA